MSAVALLTATGVLDIEMPSKTGQFLTSLSKLMTDNPTSPSTSRNIDIIITGAIMANPLGRFRKLCNQFHVKRSRNLRTPSSQSSRLIS
jgi:hypothetical protein